MSALVNDANAPLAVRLVREHPDEYDPVGACDDGDLRPAGHEPGDAAQVRVRPTEIDVDPKRPRVSSAENRELWELPRKNRELEQTRSKY